MHMTMLRSSASTPADLARLRAFVAARGAAALSILDRHLARPRYRPAFTRIAERAGQIDTAPGPALRRATESDIDDLAALYDAAYQALPLTAARSAHDWRFWLAGV